MMHGAYNVKKTTDLIMEDDNLLKTGGNNTGCIYSSFNFYPNQAYLNAEPFSNQTVNYICRSIKPI